MPLTIPKTLRWKKPSKTPVKTKKATKVKPRTVKVKKTAVKPKTVVVKPKKQTVKATKKPVKTKKATKVKPRTVKVKKTAVKPVSAVPKAIKPTKATDVRMWYYTAYPDDDQWAEIRSNITFADVMDCLKSGEDFYTYVGEYIDNIVRARIIGELATIYDMPSSEIYDMWLKPKKSKYVSPPPKSTAVPVPKPRTDKVTKATEIAVWYEETYDPEGWESGSGRYYGIEEGLTFADVMEGLQSGKLKGDKFYSSLGVNPLIRERIFEELAIIYRLHYNDIYKMWFDSSKQKSILPPKSDDDLMKEMIIQHMKNPEKSSDFVKEHFIIARVPPANPTPQKSIKKKTAAKVKPVKKKTTRRK